MDDGGGPVVISGSGSGTRAVPSLPPPSPRSPPEYPDLYGKRRESTRVQMLEREICFLQEELKLVEGLEPASRCCKEVVEFSLTNSDTFIPTYPKSRERSCGGFWKWLWSGISRLNFSRECCCCCHAFCPPDLNLPCRCICESCINCPECRCTCESCIKCPECRCPSLSFPKCLRSSCCRLRLPKWSRPSCCCRNRSSCCWVPRITCTCWRCPWNYCSCGNCPWDCGCGSCCRIRRCCVAWPKCSCNCGCRKCGCPELWQNPCSCFSCRGLRCINPCYYCC